MKYTIPEEYYYRLHHIRPRFKNDVENVLIFMATEIAKLQPDDRQSFKEKLNRIIKLYPGNSSKEIKTINNWRTEISSLFGLIEYVDSTAMAGRMSKLLADNQDLIEFFRYFIFYFQYPGGHLKPKQTAELINAGIKFKPASYIIQVLIEGQKRFNGKFGMSKGEAAHCIFNDLRVTRDSRTPSETVDLILENRVNKIEYDQGGDITRYAGDILDYMELADLVKLKPNYKYYLNTANLETIQAFITDTGFFEQYEQFYGQKNVSVQSINETQDDWFAYVNGQLKSSIFEADVISLIEEIGENAEVGAQQSEFIYEVLRKIRESVLAESALKTKEIGDVGETVVLEHEKTKITSLGRGDLVHLILKIPNQFAVGYDIQSVRESGDKKYIEVKTSISRSKLANTSFHMTTNEWSSANTLQNSYYVYRLMISKDDLSLFVIHNPVGKYKEDKVEMIPRDGADIRYSKDSGFWESLLI
ncbi:MAG: DUF3883 domain-containing protein [bacterium]|nr:DUF3883 domain-containing protein [bacterium]